MRWLMISAADFERNSQIWHGCEVQHVGEVVTHDLSGCIGAYHFSFLKKGSDVWPLLPTAWPSAWSALATLKHLECRRERGKFTFLN